MTPIDALQALARGERPRDALLPPCRLEGLGTHAYGEEAIVSHFRQVPFEGLEATDTVSSPSCAAIFAGEAALFADTYDNRILRIWRLGSGEPCAAEPSIGLPFDTDLFQSRRDVALRREDHPELDLDGVKSVGEIGYSLAHGWQNTDGPPNWRTRPFLLRAFSSGNTGAALFAVHRLGPGQQRSSGFSFTAAKFGVGSDRSADLKIIRDLAGEKAIEKRPWRMHFA